MKPTSKKSFIIYTDFINQMQLLSDEEAGIVFKAILQYNLTGEKPHSDNRIVDVVLTGLITQIDHNTQKYEQIREKRSEAGKKGNEKRWHQTTPSTSEKNNDNSETKEEPISSQQHDKKCPDHEKRIEKNKEKFIDTINPYANKYDREMLNDFFRYWTELNPSHTKMRFEMQKTWETGKRLATWYRKSYNHP